MNPRKRENEYLVKWESKPQTWEPASHLDSCKDLIENFEVLLAKQKEMRSKSQAVPSQSAQPAATSTPTSSAQPVTNRPVRFSKEKAINQVKQWTGGNKHNDDSAESSGKRKLEDEDEYEEEMDGDDVDDEDYELESSWEKKKMAQQLGQTSVKRIKTDSQNGIRMIQANKSGSDMQIGATVVRKVIGTKSPDVIMAGLKQQSGVFKKASPAAVIQKKPGEGQVRIVASKDQVQSGIVRVGANTTPQYKTGIVSRVVPKPSPATQIRPSPGTGTVVRTVQSVQNQQKTLAQKIIQRSPIAGSKVQPPAGRPVAQVVQRQSARSPATQIVRKPGTPQQALPPNRRSMPAQVGRVVKKGTAISNHDEDDDGIPDPFPKDLPPIEAENESPPPLTLCPITGKVLGLAEGEPQQSDEQEAEGESSDSHQITQLLTNEDGTPIYITGDDGTMYQVAGKNANGETILISTNAEGEQTCVLLPADQDLLAGLPGIQTTDASEAIESEPMTVDAAVAEAVSAAGEQAEGEQFYAKEGDETSQDSEEVTQPLSIAVGGESGDSQDGQITAEIVQADEPSPGELKIRHSGKVFLYYSPFL